MSINVGRQVNLTDFHRDHGAASRRRGQSIYLLTGTYRAGADPMTLTNLPPGSGLFVLLALFLTVATIRILLYAIETRPKDIDAQSFFVFIIVIIPFVMVIYLGLATIICNEIVAARSS